jgi:penicillin-binding protein 1A
MTPSARPGSRAARSSSKGSWQHPPPSGRPTRGWLRTAVRIVLVVPALLVFAAALLLFSYAFTSVPLPSDLDLAPTMVYDVRGEEIGELQQQATRDDVSLVDLPSHVADSVLAAEDARFYDHRGVSIPGIARAAYTNVRHGEIRQGGSTISQQYVKNLTGAADDTFLRKINEAVLAVKLERRYAKDEILELYLNSIYFGRGAYGIQAAARAYFGVDAADLSPEQAALIAGVIPAPSALDPARDPAGAEERYAYVLRRLGEEGLVSPDELARMRDDYPDVEPSRVIVSRRAPFFLAMVEKELADTLGPERVHRGLAVRTSLDLRMQDAAERAYREAFEDWVVPEDAVRPTGALVALDPETGGIRALVGGQDYASDQYNLAVGGPRGLGRQPGSTFKTFGLAAWMVRGYSADTMFDAPAQVTFTAEELGADEPWEPRNFGDADLGRITLREATWRSANTAFARLAVDLGPSDVLDTARRAGIDPGGKLRPDPALVLGTGEVTPLRLAEAYNTFASGGIHRAPASVLEVSSNGDLLLSTNTDGRQAVDEQVAYHVSDVLQGVLGSGTGTAAAIDRPAAGKTGTTSNNADAWFAGYTPDLTAVVWMGHRDDNQPMHDAPTGGGFPAELWAAFMSEALAEFEATPFPEPMSDLKVVGALPDCPPGQELVPADADDPDGEMVCVAVETDEQPEDEPADEPEDEVGDDPDREPAAEPEDPDDPEDDAGEDEGDGEGGEPDDEPEPPEDTDADDDPDELDEGGADEDEGGDADDDPDDGDDGAA